VSWLRDHMPARRDAITVAALMAGGFLEAMLFPGSAHYDVNRAVTGLCLAVAIFPLAWRGRAPLGSFVVYAVLFNAFVAAGVPLPNVVCEILALLFACYTVGARLERALVGLALVVAAISPVALQFEYHAIGDLLFPVLFFGVMPWGAGVAVRRRERLTLELAEKGRLLEHEREERAKAAVADERARIAREMHDLVAHSLSTMVVQAGAGQRMVAIDPARAEAAAQMIEDTGRNALNELRRLLGVLRHGDEELALTPQPTLPRINTLVGRARAAGLIVTYTVEGDPVPLPSGVELTGYRIVQEALANVMQHAGPATALVRVAYEEDDVEIEVSDTGTGPHPGDGDGRDGHGLVGMRERVRLYGGELHTGPLPGGGWSVRATLPCREREAIAV
jgi:signal transduction histidine kinase